MTPRFTEDIVLFFDMDGTLIDTNLANFLSYKKAIHVVTKITHDLKYNSDKRLTRNSLRNVVSNLKDAEYEKIIQEKEKYYQDFLHEIKLNKSIANILFKYSKTNKTVLVTNCRRDRALTTLNHFGLADKFTEIFCREIADSGKTINKYQNAISKLGISPNLVIAFENEEAEITDAKHAGIKIINPQFI